MSMLSEKLAELPLLVGLSIPRIGDDVLPGRYDSNQQVWVTDEQDSCKPIIEAAGGLAELSTKTEVKPERDDVSGTSLMALLQLVTKTLTQFERDDQ